jgi:hypothetical protein
MSDLLNQHAGGKKKRAAGAWPLFFKAFSKKNAGKIPSGPKMMKAAAAEYAKTKKK